MIPQQELRKTARERGLTVDLVEKDYVLGWLLFGVASSSVSQSLAFKGGTALSKVYFPGQWRLSEDLDFTILDETGFDVLAKSLREEVPEIVSGQSGIPVALKTEPFTNPGYLQSRFQYAGPISKNTAKVEVSREGFIGDVVVKELPQMYDYPRLSVRVYSLANLLGEKIRTLLERGKVKDYYDVWKLLKTEKFDRSVVKGIFLEKCDSKGVKFERISQFFPTDLIDVLRPYLKTGLTRLTPEPLPALETMISELKTDLGKLLA